MLEYFQNRDGGIRVEARSVSSFIIEDMLNKLRQALLRGEKLAEYYIKHNQLDKAKQELLKIGQVKKAGEILVKMKKFHEAANLYIQDGDVDKSRRTIEKCFREDEGWESFEPNGQSMPIEVWLKKNNQTRRFVRYVQNVETRTPRGTPVIVLLAEKLRENGEYKSAAELYRKGFFLVNKNVSADKITNEAWLRHATECYARENLYADAAECMKKLMMTEVQIGSDISKNYRYNPYRNYTVHLKMARDLRFLRQLVEVLEDFDPFNIAYDLIKLGEIPLSIDVFFKYYGRIAKKEMGEKEQEIRNEKVSYCLNQYVIYHRNHKNYDKAAEIALMNDQKKIAADLYKMAELQKKIEKDTAQFEIEDVQDDSADSGESTPREVIEKEIHCPHCGEVVKPSWEICPNCENMLTLNICSCGQKIKPHWKRCPDCGKELS